MTTRSLTHCFEQFTVSAFRLEGLPFYNDPAPVGLRSMRSNRYLQRIARAVMDGKDWTHIRLIDDPVTDYQHDQLTTGLVELHAVGADVRVLRRGLLPIQLYDFWLFDRGAPDAAAVLMDYDADGTPLPDLDEYVNDPRHLADLNGIASDLVRLSTPLAEYAAAVNA